uniref:DNA repair protein RAD4 n=1 Tax=Vitis vinifera TaxID=29760 RepID=F6HSJ2_VITVI
MRTRNQCKQKNHSSDNSDAAKALNDESGTLAEISREAVGKLLRRANPRRSSGIRKLDSCSQQCESTGLIGSKRSEILDTGGRVTWNALDSEGCGRSAIGRSTLEKEVDEKSSQDTYLNSGEDINESDWEEGSIPTLDSVDNHQNAGIKEVTIELSGLLDSSQQKPIRRASAEDKELAELVHKVHLLCLLARGRLIDSACNDPLVQASLLSLLPADLLKISEIPRLTANAFTLLVRWFHDNFRVRSPSSVERPLHSSLAFALEAHEGTPEEKILYQSKK